MSCPNPAAKRGYPAHRSGLAAWVLALPLLLALVALLTPATARALAFTSAVKDLSCAGFRAGSKLTCTAGEFTVSPVFSAEPGTPPFCIAGSTFNFKVDLGLSGTNTDRYDIAFYVGQQGNDPRDQTAGNICSVATFPTTPAPWEDDDSNTCGDFNGTGNETTRINEIKVVCSGDSSGALTIPYVLTYKQNTGGTCTGPSDVTGGSTSKCNAGTSPVSGTVAVYSGAYVDITKATSPTGTGQSFSFTATGPSGSKVVVLTGATLTATSATGGTYSPATISAATNSTTFSLTEGQTARVYINALSTAQNLTITESTTTGWSTTATWSCSNVTGSPTVTIDGPNRSVTAALTSTNSAAACTITNRKPATVTLTKVSNGDVGTFTFTGTNGWASQNITTASAGVGVAGATQTLTAASTATDIIESAVTGWRLTGISCSGLGAGGTATPDLANRKVTLDAAATAGGSNIACTFTNVRQRTLTVTKSLSPVADSGKFVMNANGTTGAEAGNGATSSASVDVGSTATFSEAAGTATSLSNYTSSYSCNTAPVTSGSGTSGSFTMPNANVTCTLTNTRKSATLTLRKTWSNAINGNTATVTSSGFTNSASSGLSTSTGNNTTTGSSVTVYAGESGTISETFGVGSAGNYTASLACTGNNTALSGNTLTINPSDTAITCTLTNTRNSATLTLVKNWVNGINGNKATVSTTGLTNNATTGQSVAIPPNNTTTGSAVTVYAGEVATISETFNTGSASNYSAGLACTGTAGLSGSTLTVGGSDTAITCTMTNTRKSATLTLRKTWSNAISGDTANVASSSFLNAATSGDSVSTGNNTTTGTAVTVYAAESGTIGETFSVGSATNYNATLACTGNTVALSGSTLTIDPADTAITCTLTNTRKSATLTLRKTWSNAISGNTATVTSSGFTNSASSGLSTSTGNNTTTGSAVTVYAGESGTLSEAFGVGSSANYNATLACTGNATALSGSTLTVNGADTAITCTMTNARKSATFTLAKAWVNGKSGDTATVSSTGFTNNASSGASASTGNNTTTGTSVTVYAGESGTISESFSMGSAGNYNASLACSGNTTALSGSTLTVNAADTAITCTYTNSRKSATLTLRKTWVNGKSGDTATVTSTGLTNNATSGASVSSGSNTTTGSAVTVYAADSGTISESFSVGSSANYTAGLACTGNATALSGSTLTINAADTAITCTYTNTRKSATLTLRKTWSNAISGDTATVSSSGFTNNGSSGASVSSGNNTTTGSAVTVYAGEAGTLSESFSSGSASNYTASLGCSGNATALSGSTLTVNAADTAITCTYTNARNSASLTLRKAWLNGISGNTATVTSTGFTNNASSGASVSSGSNTTTGSAVTVYAGESGSIAESFSSGSASNYSAGLACAGSSGLSGSTLTVGGSDTAITCTMTNTRKSASLTLRKTWVSGKSGDTATVSSTGFTNNASSGASVSSGSNTTTGSAVTVYAAEVGTLSESFSVGSATDYTVSISCSGSSGLSGSTLTVGAGDTSIVCTYTNTAKLPVLTLQKTSWVFSDPRNGTSNPKSIPGAVRTYSLRLTNAGPVGVDNNGVVVTTPVPANMDLFVGDIGGAGSGPIVFSDGSPSSGLSWTFTSLSSGTDSVDFSLDGSGWTYTPVPDGSGFDSAVRYIRLKPTGSMNAAAGGNPYADFQFRVRLR